MSGTGPLLRLVAAAAALGTWLALYFLGRTLGGALHLLLPAAGVLLFWRSGSRAAARSRPDSENSP